MTDQSHQCVIIGIAGASASGKSLIASTLYRELREQVGDEHIGVIPEDCYYKDQSHLSMEERVKTNYDHPSAMDHSLLLEHLQALKRGSAIDLPVYSYVEHTRMKETVTVEPKKVMTQSMMITTQTVAATTLEVSEILKSFPIFSREMNANTATVKPQIM